MPSSKPKKPKPSSKSQQVAGEYFFLDVGKKKYGECIMVRFGNLSVLIDGGHDSDFEGQEGTDSIPQQLEEVFGHRPPFDVSLVVVTHAHDDHIGCLPRLVSERIIAPQWALITDSKLGFGRCADESHDAPDLVDARTSRLAAVLREEDASDLSDEEFQKHIDAVGSVESRYAAFVKQLGAVGCEVVEYRGQELPAALAKLMESAQMVVLGPSTDQLVLAADQIATTNKDSADAVARALAADSSLSDIALYRTIVAQQEPSDSGHDRGSAMNCQSITLAFGPENARVLLAGDMQFVGPISEAGAEVATLRSTVAEHGPYRVFKSTHHTSDNGQDDELLTQLGNPDILIHSGGANDRNHPNPAVLTIIKRRRRQLKFARTDRNGRILVTLDRSVGEAINVSRGRLNDFTTNSGDEVVPAGAAIGGGGTTASLGSGQVVIVTLPSGPVDMTVAGVDIVVRSPGGVVATFSPDRRPAPLARNPRPGSGASSLSIDLASGRELPRLLFVTDRERLEGNIGAREVDAAITAIGAKGHVICDVSNCAASPISKAKECLAKDKEIAGIVIAGGYDVVPSSIVDVLTPALRTALVDDIRADGDEFYVWSDEPYGDLDDDHIAERPISRIPDARDATLFLTALQSQPPVPAERFGVRNVKRPFAETVWGTVTGNRGLEVSERFLADQISPAHTACACHYLMLHGSVDDATSFAGEYTNTNGGYPTAFKIDNVPSVFRGLVFSGCCWGALTVTRTARDSMSATPTPRVPEQSIALSYLKAGANAFVGCTGSHYSGVSTSPKSNYALPLHHGFWSQLPELGYAGSPALYGARWYYSRVIIEGPGGRAPLDLARRLKNRAQFTCLGLGW
jgi:hypothetical protein